MVAPITAGKPSASATKAIAEASIMTISPFCSCVKNLGATTVGSMPGARRGRCDGHHQMFDCYPQRIPFLAAVLEHRLVAQECGDLRVPLELGQILRRGQFRLIARGI